MASNDDMWAAYREGNQQLWSLVGLHSQLEREEGAAFDASVQAESRMRLLGDQIQDLDEEFSMAKAMLRAALDSREADSQFEQRADEARDTMRRIHGDMMIVCYEAFNLDITRNQLCDEEEAKDMAGDYITSKIEELKTYLEHVLANGCANN